MISLGDLPGGRYDSAVHAISADGSVIVGAGSIPFDVRAVRWVDGGPIEDLGNLPTNTVGGSSRAYDVSDDGSIIVGFAWRTASAIEGAFRWTEEGGMQLIPYPPDWNPNSGSKARLISGDGRIIYGFVSSDVVWRWTEETGTQWLGFWGRLRDTTPDGSVVIGSGLLPEWPAFIWDECGGYRQFRPWIEDRFDIDMTFPYYVSELNGISADGRTIVGTGEHLDTDQAEGFILRLPPLIAGDFNDDGLIDTDDAAILFTTMPGPGETYPPCRRADLNLDGFADLRDVAFFQRVFTGPCMVAGDLDGDCAFGPPDVARLVDCMNGPEIISPCTPADLDHDGDVDLADYARFQMMIGS